MFFVLTVPRSQKHRKRIKLSSIKAGLCEGHEDKQLYYLFNPDELEYPKDMRTSETETSSSEQAKSFITSY